MTVEQLERTDIGEQLTVRQVREALEEIDAYVPETDALKGPLPEDATDLGTPLFDQLRDELDVKPDWWWAERFEHIADRLREEVETDHLQQLGAGIADAVVQVSDENEVFVTIHGVNPEIIDTSSDGGATRPLSDGGRTREPSSDMRVQIEIMPEYEPPPVAGQVYDESQGWHENPDNTIIMSGGSIIVHGETTALKPGQADTRFLGEHDIDVSSEPKRRWWERLTDWLRAY